MHIIKEEAERMNKLVKDLLTLSTIKGKTKTDFVPASPKQLIYKILKVVQKKAAKKGTLFRFFLSIRKDNDKERGAVGEKSNNSRCQ